MGDFISEAQWPRLPRFYLGEENGSMVVVPRCSHCGRFIKVGKVLYNMRGEIKFEGWHCTACDKDSIPDWEWVDDG